MQFYFEPIRVALEFFPLIALVMIGPLAVLHWRRYGRLQGVRALILYSFILYSIVALFLVILPLPKPGPDFVRRYARYSHPQLVPFHFVRLLVHSVPASTWTSVPGILSLFGRRVFLQAVLNFLLLLPLGFYLRYYFRISVLVAIPIVFVTTVMFELLQYSALFGLYPAPYRLFDVDDIIVNTFGGIVGFFAAPAAERLFPVPSPRPAVQSSQVGYARRLVAFAADLSLSGVGILAVRLLLLWSGAAPVALPPAFQDTALRYLPAPISWGWLIDAAVLALVFVILPAVRYGRTPGKALVRLMIVGNDRRPPGTPALFVRYLVELFLPIALLRFTLGDPALRNLLGSWVDTVGVLLLALLALVYLLPPVIRRDRRGIHELASGTRTISTHAAARRRAADPGRPGEKRTRAGGVLPRRPPPRY